MRLTRSLDHGGPFGSRLAPTPTTPRAHGRGLLRLSALRWLVMLVFLPGLIGANQGPAAGRMLGATLVYAAATAVVLSQLHRPIGRTLWASMLLFVFVMGYYIKIFVILSDSGSWADMDRLTNEDLTEALEWSSAGFVAFALVAWLLLRRPGPLPGQMAGRRSDARPARVMILIGALFPLALLTSYLPIAFGFGQMGIFHNPLPYRLDAVVTHARITVIPIVCLLLLWITDHPGQKKQWAAVLALFFGTAILDSFVRASRLGLLFAAIPLLFLWCLSGRMTPIRKLVLVTVAGITIVGYQFITVLRGARINAGGFDWSQLSHARDHSQSQDSLELLMAGLRHIAIRVSGIDGLAHNLHYGLPDYDPQRLTWLLDSRTMGGYQTHEVVGIPWEIVEGRAPGLVGAFSIVGQFNGMLLLVAGYTLAVGLAWRRLTVSPIAPVALAFFANAMLTYTSEGVMGIQGPISWCIGLVCAHYVYAWLARPARQRHAARTASALDTGSGRWPLQAAPVPAGLEAQGATGPAPERPALTRSEPEERRDGQHAQDGDGEVEQAQPEPA